MSRVMSVDEYIASKPEAGQGVLERVRSAIRKGAPGAEESISYNMPTYKVRGMPVLYFAGWKQHYSLYPIGEHVVAAFREELAEYEVEKHRAFPFSDPVP